MRVPAAVPVVAALVAVFSPCPSAGAESRPRYGGVVEATLLGAPATLDPLLARSHADVTVAGLLFDTLFRVAADGSVQPALAADAPTLDEKRTTVFIPIRTGVRLHDGTELTASDVALSIERARQQARWLLAPVLSIKADEGGVVLSLRAPVADLAGLLALPQTAVVKAGRPVGERAIGSGPFIAESFDRARRTLQLRAFDEHFAGRPYVDTLVLTWYETPDGEARRFETGRSHVSARGATAFAGAKPSFRVASVDSTPALLVFVGFGRAHKAVTDDKAFRRSLDLALARGGLAAINAGERVIPTRSPLPAAIGGAALDAAGGASDLSAAQAQLADAARRVASLAPSKIGSLRLEVLIDDARPDDREIAERVVLALDKLGIGALITPLPSHTLRERVTNGTCDLWIGQLAQPLAAPPLWWAFAFAAGSDEWPVAQLQSGSLDVAAAAHEFASRLPIVPLMFRSIRMWHPTNLRGLGFDGGARPSYADVTLFGVPTPGSPPGKVTR